MKKDKKLFLAIDANAIVHRAYHAYPSTLRTSEGLQVNAVYGFTTMFLVALERFKPDYIACAFDTDKPTFRHQEFPDYKATRKPTDDALVEQFPRIEEVLEAFNIPILKSEGYEADDILGTLSKYFKEGKWSNQNLEMIILTGDKDLLQLVGDDVKVCLPKKSFKNLKVYNKEGVKDNYGYYPSQVVDFKGMVGDSSDNIPGIKGVGEKTALDLLSQYEDWKGIYDNLEEIGGRKADLLKEGLEQGEFSRRLARIDQKVPLTLYLEDCLMKDYLKSDVIDLFAKYEFKSLINKIPDSNEDDLLKVVRDGTQLGLFSTSHNSGSYIKAGDIDFEGFFDDVEKIRMMYLEGDELESREWMVYLYIEKDTHQKYIVIHSEQGGKRNNLLTLTQGFTEWLDSNSCETYFYGYEDYVSRIENEFGMKFDEGILKNISYKILDVQLMAHLLSSGDNKYTFSSLVFKYLKKALKDKLNSTDINNCLDLLELLGEELVGMLEKEEKKSKYCKELEGNIALFTEFDNKDFVDYPYKSFSIRLVDNRFAVILAEMENRGLKVNYDLLKKYDQDLRDSISKIEIEAYEVVGYEFNMSSPKQLSEILYEELELDGGLTNKKQKSTKESILRKLQDVHPLVPLILEYRKLSKLHNTYVDAYLEKSVKEEEGYFLYSNFSQIGTSSGRLSSSNPNLQNIPIQGEWAQKFRNVLIARKGYKMVTIDYSQIESRIMAEFSADKKLLEDFYEGKDIHKSTAARIFDKPIKEVTKKERRVGKTINFGILYGQTSYGLSKQLDISREEASSYIDNYFINYKGVSDYIQKMHESARRNGYVETMLGRRRYIKGLDSSNRFTKQASLREAVNMPIQGSASDLMKIAMISLDYNLLQDEKYREKVFMLLQVHDEVVFEVKEELIEKFEKDACDIIIGVGELLGFEVPLEVHFSFGEKMSELK